MKKILDFKSFLNESTSLGAKINLPPGVLKHFSDDLKHGKYVKSVSSRRVLSQIENLPLFESLNTEDVDADGYEEVVMKIDNKTIVFPYLKYDKNIDTLNLSNNFVSPKKEIDDFVDLLVSQGLMKKHIYGIKHILAESLETIGKTWDSSYKNLISYNIPHEEILNNYCQSLVYNLIGQIKETIYKGSKTFNPFTDTDLYNNENIKALERMGTVIDSPPNRIKKGTIVFRNPVYEYGIAITPTGYIRNADKEGIITSNHELVKPIYNEDDLNIKLVYLRIYTMKKKLQEVGLNSKEIKEIIDLIGKDSKEYADKVREVVKLHPRAVLALPEPKDGFETELVKGVKTLTRFGVFG